MPSGTSLSVAPGADHEFLQLREDLLPGVDAEVERRKEQLDRIITVIVMTSLPIAFYGRLQRGDGKTTLAQVNQEFGSAKTDKTAPDGTHTVTYALMQQQSSSEAHTPFLGPWSGKTTQVENDLTMTFDRNGVLQSHSSAIKPAPDASNQ